MGGIWHMWTFHFDIFISTVEFLLSFLIEHLWLVHFVTICVLRCEECLMSQYPQNPSRTLLARSTFLPGPATCSLAAPHMRVGFLPKYQTRLFLFSLLRGPTSE